ncbi:MAG TPA: transglutaminaseTgpA domain-containing protein [Ktedonobacterales bacterium]|nr:transglutaminaseTgpA domain-containing protein [Ktedonobacterales bacterium]
MSTVSAPPRPGYTAPAPDPRPETSGAHLRAVVSRYFVLYPEDGIATLLLVAAVVFTTSLCIQAPQWAPGLNILTPITLLGLLYGYLAVQQRVVPPFITHLFAVALSVALALWLAARAVLGGDERTMITHARFWLYQALHNQRSDDNDMFLLCLAALVFVLAYLSMWLVVRSRRPWLAVLANGIVLIINLNYASPDIMPFLVVYLLAALLLLVRFTLADNVRLWRKRQLRFSPDLNWDFLQAGAVLAVTVLLLAYLLPVAPANAAINHAVTDPNSAWQAIQQRWAGLFGSVNGPGTNGVGFFSGSLELKGNVDLSTAEILRYISDDPTQYLVAQTFDTYDEPGTWSQSLTSSVSYKTNAVYPAPSAAEHTINQTIYLTNYSGQRNLFAAGEPASFDMPTEVEVTAVQGIPTAWFAQRELLSGQTYHAASYLSTATEDDLRAISYPKQAGEGEYPAEVLRLDVQGDTPIPPEVAATAATWTAGTKNPYDAMVELENHLHAFRYNLHNGNIPAGEDAVVWFLHNQSGFCTFFASTMALMARSLGMPARVATGMINGEYDSAHRDYVVRGTSLHVWTQVYFPGYGWINFEPTSTFASFARAQPTTTTSEATATAQAGGGTGARATATPKFFDPTENVGGTTHPNTSSPLVTVGITLAFLVLLLLLVASGFLLWWRAAYRGQTPAGGALARVARLGAWLGAPPRREQTPYEYAETLGARVPEEQPTFHQLSDLYVRERWGQQAAPGGETTSLYQRAQVALVRGILGRWREVAAWLFGWARPLTHGVRTLGERLTPALDNLFDRMLTPPGGR